MKKIPHFIDYENTISGDIGTLPAGLTYFNVQGSGPMSGDIGTLPAGLTYFNVQESDTTTAIIAAACDDFKPQEGN